MPSARRRSSSTRSRSGSVRWAGGPAGSGRGSRSRRTSSSVCRTDSSWPMTESRTRSCSSGARPPSARPWPSVSRPSATAAWTPGRELEQPERVGHRRSGPADPRRDLVLAEPELVDQLPVGLGGLERIEVLALEVLDERELELVAIGELADDGRDPLQAGRLGGAEATLAGDELVAIDRLGDEDRLEHAVLGDALRSASASPSGSNRLRGWCGFGWIRDVAISMRDGLAGASLRDERGEAAPEALRTLGSDGHDATINSCELGVRRASARPIAAPESRWPGRHRPPRPSESGA